MSEPQLQLYKCHKTVHAAPMTDAQYRARFNEKGQPFSMAEPKAKATRNVQSGYLVVYNMGTDTHYELWSPKEPFDEGYTLGISSEVESPKGSFGWAVDRMKQGAKVARTGWNGSGMFAYYVPGGSFPSKSHAIKGVFEGELVPYRHYLALKTAQGDIATWSPSTSDALAEDWVLVE